MKKLIIMTLLMMTLALSQSIKVVNTLVLLEKTGNTEFAFPKFSPDGQKVLFTTAGYRGLWLLDLKSNTMTQLNDARGAGYEPVFSEDGREVIFRHEKLINKRRYFSIAAQKITGVSAIDLIVDERGISTPKAAGRNAFVYKQNGEQVKISYQDNKPVCSLAKSAEQEINAFCENSKLYLEKEGHKTELSPVGEGHYIWGSISPNQDKILFTCAGKGTFISDLTGKIEMKLDHANYPRWSRDGQWVLYMEDHDDGHIILSSEIKVTHLKSQKSFALTNSNDKIEMYPSWSPKGDAVVYHTLSGNIELLRVEIQE
ncbi:MAG: PD40 domain-containing protein [Candidatus Marinimicrobia bacterium]|nr:PD40 domain-containing protein [Candidatus Neomarinimicrobiota bacterium]